jgi:hypothetical protein
VDRVITPLKDTVVESTPETVTVTLTDRPEYDLGATSTGTVTISD